MVDVSRVHPRWSQGRLVRARPTRDPTDPIRRARRRAALPHQFPRDAANRSKTHLPHAWCRSRSSSAVRRRAIASARVCSAFAPPERHHGRVSRSSHDSLSATAPLATCAESTSAPSVDVLFGAAVPAADSDVADEMIPRRVPSARRSADCARRPERIAVPQGTAAISAVWFCDCTERTLFPDHQRHRARGSEARTISK